MNEWKCCRTCLNDQNLLPIFVMPEQSEKYSSVLFVITGVKIEVDDTLPQEMCNNCITFVNNCIKFRRKCDQANNILKNNTCDIKLEPCLKTEDVTISIDISDGSKEDNKTDEDTITSDQLQQNKNTSNNKKCTNDSNTAMKRNKNVDRPRKSVKEEIECEYCRKILTSRLSLRNHYKIHTGFDVVCEHCGKKFITRRLLLMHCRAKHGYEKTDKCSFCDYRASNAEQVKIHERLHTGEKPFVCKECNTGFHRKSSYLQHIAIHLPEKTVQCDQCSARFKSVTLMRIHKSRHRPAPYSFKCAVCENSFVRRRNVIRHLLRVHGLEGDEHVTRVKVG
ncbi:hypothetical protein KGM_215021 [Danaus plexippus plexippus]|uniref:Uncharacterized protein n=1 Tax=Danaus plexippus plexippus TaxID=278856 RepID=A0A212F2R2_DANPL|nr:hypothetical protein KGM_215021 [Danaus plexippus plexippus]